MEETREIFRSQLTNSQFNKLRDYITGLSGIKISDNKQTMLESRIRRRLRALEINNFTEYLDYLFSGSNAELETRHLLDAVTTNKTDFFREPDHYNELANRLLPDMLKKYQAGRVRPLRVWSAGCSTGAEIYSLAMIIDDFGRQYDYYKYHITGTDISGRVLETAKTAIYPEHLTHVVPEEFKQRYMLRSKDKSKNLIRFVPSLRAKTTIKRLNFMDDHYGFANQFDVIFCRNVLIYFEKEVQHSILRKICKNLIIGGYLLLGHSETIMNMDLPLKTAGITIYEKVK